MESTKNKQEAVLIRWDVYEILKHEARSAIDEIEGDGEVTLTDAEKEKITNRVMSDSDLIRCAWNSEMEYLTGQMMDINPGGVWFAEVVGFGWDEMSGASGFEASTGEKLLEQILPKTDCTFNVYEMVDDKGCKYLALNNFHRDSPIGKEWYYIYPALKCGKCGDIKIDEYMRSNDIYGILCNYCSPD